MNACYPAFVTNFTKRITQLDKAAILFYTEENTSMQRYLSIVLLLAVLALLPAGCGGGSSEATPTAAVAGP
ncbi:MAG: hypothetical protein KIS72_07100, partial [Luteimonas sp.]|nr:hypothetical protein [Luteimonas sp.]